MRVTKFVHIDSSNQYMAMIRATWGSRLKQVFAEIPDPTWFDSYVPPGAPRPNRDRSAGARAAAAVCEAKASPRRRCNWSGGHSSEGSTLAAPAHRPAYCAYQPPSTFHAAPRT